MKFLFIVQVLEVELCSLGGAKKNNSIQWTWLKKFNIYFFFFRCIVSEVFSAESRNRIEGFANALLEDYREDEFRMFFRMSKKSAREFIEHVKRVVSEEEVQYLSPRTVPGGRTEVSYPCVLIWGRALLFLCSVIL